MIWNWETAWKMGSPEDQLSKFETVSYFDILISDFLTSSSYTYNRMVEIIPGDRLEKTGIP